MAYIDDDGRGWDYAEKMSDALPENYINPWSTEVDEKKLSDHHAARHEASAIWDALPEMNRAWFDVFSILPYENIIDIDEKGDEHFAHPHIYTIPFIGSHGPFRTYQRVTLENIDRCQRRRIVDDPVNRVEKFPRRLK
jgi:hypothetical protein